MSEYFVVHLNGVSTPAEEELSAFAFSSGALGVSEVLPFEQPEGFEDVYTRIPNARAVDVYFQTRPASDFLEGVRSRWPEVSIRIASETERDWLAEWKKGFKPFPLVGGHWVVPSWCEAPAEATHQILIDPGMAFGTGTHETTQLVARTMAQVCSGKFSCLDVGTGTGILAILARQMGLTHVRGTEIEEDSRRVARENFALNGFDDIVLDEHQVEQLVAKFDIVVANIIDGVLVQIQEALKSRVKPGGWLLVSGIIAEREPDFLAGFKLDKPWDIREQQGDWILYGVKL